MEESRGLQRGQDLDFLIDYLDGWFEGIKFLVDDLRDNGYIASDTWYLIKYIAPPILSGNINLIGLEPTFQVA